MPPLPAAPGVIKVTENFTIGADTSALNRFYIHYSGTAPTPTQLTTFAIGVDVSIGAFLTGRAASNVTWEQVVCEDLSSASGAIGSGGVGRAGTRAVHSIPAGSCFMEQFAISRRYRGGKPKIFLPFGGAEDLAVGLVWSGAAVTEFDGNWVSHITDVLTMGWPAAGTLEHVNVSYFSGFTVVTNPITHRARNVPTVRGAPVIDPVIGYLPENGVASQRRRNVV